jgi:hypothetical protein
MNLQDAKDAVRVGVGEVNQNPYLAWAKSLNQRLCKWYAVTAYGTIPTRDWLIPVFYAKQSDPANP